MIQLNFLNAVVEDNGNGLRVNGKDLNSIISAALGTIKKIPGRYEYLGEENKGKPFESQLCNVSVTIDDISTEITETITFVENGNVQEVTLAEFEKGLEDEHSQEVKQEMCIRDSLGIVMCEQ